MQTEGHTELDTMMQPKLTKTTIDLLLLSLQPESEEMVSVHKDSVGFHLKSGEDTCVG